MTKPSFAQMNALKAKYEGKDFVILAYPSHDFMNQEPSDPKKPEELLNEIKYVRPGNNYEHKVDIIFAKVDVNGENTEPVYTFMKDSCPVTAQDFFPANTFNYKPVAAKDIVWNYEKFLVGRDGKVYARYASLEIIAAMLEPDINHLLAQTI